MTTALIVAFAGAASAGNLSTFEEPQEPAEEAAGLGMNNAAWIIPLVAILAIAAASGGNGGGGGGSDEESVTDDKCPADPRCADL